MYCLHLYCTIGYSTCQVFNALIGIFRIFMKFTHCPTSLLEHSFWGSCVTLYWILNPVWISLSLHTLPCLKSLASGFRFNVSYQLFKEEKLRSIREVIPLNKNSTLKLNWSDFNFSSLRNWQGELNPLCPTCCLLRS